MHGPVRADSATAAVQLHHKCSLLFAWWYWAAVEYTHECTQQKSTNAHHHAIVMQVIHKLYLSGLSASGMQLRLQLLYLCCLLRLLCVPLLLHHLHVPVPLRPHLQSVLGLQRQAACVWG